MTVTDINARRTGYGKITFNAWSDEMISARLTMLDNIEAGDLDLSMVPGPLIAQVFPSGYDPDNNPAHNRATVWAEARRRGLI